MTLNFKHSIIFVMLILIVALSACDGGGETAVSPDEASQDAETAADAITLGLLTPTDNAFFISLQEGAQEAADRLNVELLSRHAGDDIATQTEQIQAMIAQGVDALIVTPVDTEAVVPALEAAHEAGIPIITVDRRAETPFIVSHIASDNEAGGHMAGDYLAETIGEAGNVVELTGIAGTSAAQDRGAGFNEAIAAYDEINLIAQETGNFNVEDGKDAFTQILTEHDDIDAVFAHNDDMILGAIAAAQEHNRAEEIVFIGFDAIEDAVAALEKGSLTATIAQQPTEMGRLGVETAVDLLQGETVPEFIPVDLALISR